MPLLGLGMWSVYFTTKLSGRFYGCFVTFWSTCIYIAAMLHVSLLCVVTDNELPKAYKRSHLSFLSFVLFCIVMSSYKHKLQSTHNICFPKQINQCENIVKAMAFCSVETQRRHTELCCGGYWGWVINSLSMSHQ